MLTLKGLEQRFGSWRLSPLAGHFPRGEITALVGPPGAGKTVLLKTLAGLIPMAGGTLSLDGRVLNTRSGEARDAWRQRVGMAFQNNALFDGLSIFENVAFPLRYNRADDQKVTEAVRNRLEHVGLWDAAQKYPHEVSGGMQRRVGLARATVRPTDIGLFDDPTAGLDPQTAADICRLIQDLTTSLSMATVIVSNDVPILLSLASRVLVLWDGVVRFWGPLTGLQACEDPDVHRFLMLPSASGQQA